MNLNQNMAMVLTGRKLIIGLGLLLFASCGPSPSKMADKYCGMFEEYLQAQKNMDADKEQKLTSDLYKMDSELQEKYAYRNPEWLMKYTQLKQKCMMEKLNAVTPK